MHIFLARSSFDTQKVVAGLHSKSLSTKHQSADELSILAQLLEFPALESRAASTWRLSRYQAPAAYSICADFVCLQAGLDTVTVGQALQDIAEDEASALGDSIQEVLLDSGWTFEPGSNGQGLIFSTEPLHGHSQPPYRLSGKNLRDYSAVKGSLQTLDAEVQMLLFDHPVNLRRTEQGRAPVSGLWFWDSVPGNPGSAKAGDVLPALYSRDATLVAAWNEMGGQVFSEASIGALQDPDWVVVLDSMVTHQAVSHYMSSGPVRPCYFVDQYGESTLLRSPSLLRQWIKRFSA